jgi:hypothetical protein
MDMMMVIQQAFYENYLEILWEYLISEKIKY